MGAVTLLNTMDFRYGRQTMGYINITMDCWNAMRQYIVAFITRRSQKP